MQVYMITKKEKDEDNSVFILFVIYVRSAFNASSAFWYFSQSGGPT